MVKLLPKLSFAVLKAFNAAADSVTLPSKSSLCKIRKQKVMPCPSMLLLRCLHISEFKEIYIFK